MIEENNNPYMETQDIECVWCKESCKDQFMTPNQFLRKWKLKGRYHFECGIEAMVMSNINTDE